VGYHHRKALPLRCRFFNQTGKEPPYRTRRPGCAVTSNTVNPMSRLASMAAVFDTFAGVASRFLAELLVVSTA
jgi:hypothetical protein